MKFSEDIDFENMIFSCIDEFKFIIFPDKWSSVFLDYSKNEIMVLLFLYRVKTANMTEISKYINAPLNTTTGVVNRLEKKKMIQRIRNKEDRRIVEIVLTCGGGEFLDEQKKTVLKWVKDIYGKLTEEEMSAAVSIFKKVREVLLNDSDNKNNHKKIRKIHIE